MLIAPTLSLVVAGAGAAPALTCAQIDAAIGPSRNEPVPPPRTATDVQISAHQPLCGGWEIVDLWKSWSGQRPIWHARRKQMSRRGVLTTALLDSDSCPAVVPAMRRLGDVPVGLAVVPPARPAGGMPLAPPPEDGTMFDLRVPSARQADGSFATVRLSASAGPLARWATEMLSALTPCWRAPARH